MMKPLRLGLVGLDTSHVTAFADLLHDPNHPHHVPGTRIVAAFPGGSPDFDLSINRVEGFTSELRDKHQVKIVETIAQLRDDCDAIFLESVDGRVHLEQFKQLADWKLPVFIDKPFACSSVDAKAISDLAIQHGVRIMSASAIRFGEPFQQVLKDEEGGLITGGDFFGPMALLEKIPGYFWYGIHSVEMLYAAFGAGCREVSAYRTELHDVIVGKWADGRIGTVRGNRTGNNIFGGTIHREKGSKVFNVSATAKPYYASLLEQIIPFVMDGCISVSVEESIGVIRFLEAANESAQSGKAVCI